MALPDSYTIKPGAIPDYFKSLINAEAPERFSTKFLESLDFKSTNDRLFIGIMKDLGFIDTDGVPNSRYYELLDKSRWKSVLAQGIKESYSALFAVNKDANTMSVEDVKNKLRTLYAGTKKDTVIAHIAKTFRALCDEADFTTPLMEPIDSAASKEDNPANPQPREKEGALQTTNTVISAGLSINALQYHINIVLPESRDQAVYDAIFKSLRDHLG